MAAAGAAFAVVNGWERVDYIKPAPDFEETHSFRFNEVFDVVARDVAAVRDRVGLCEVNGFNRYELTGPGVHAFLDRMVCGRVPRRAGRVGLCYLLNHHGMIKAEATIATLPNGRVWYGSAAAAEFHDMDWLRMHLTDTDEVQLRSLTNHHTILVVAGPKAREVMRAVSRADWSAEAFGWLSVQNCFVGVAPAVVMSVSFSGELAYEVHVPNAQLYAAYLALQEAGEAQGMQIFGARAVDAMRMEKGFLHWKSDLLTEFDPFETGLERFVTLDKPGFVGREALIARAAAGPRRKLVTLHVHGDAAPAHPGASVMLGGRVVGTVTSGDWGHRVGMNLAYAFVGPDHAAPGTQLGIDIIGTETPAGVIPACPYDPGHARMRA